MKSVLAAFAGSAMLAAATAAFAAAPVSGPQPASAAPEIPAPLDGLSRGGYRLVYTDSESAFEKGNEKIRKYTDFSFSLGFTVGKDGGLRYPHLEGAASGPNSLDAILAAR